MATIMRDGSQIGLVQEQRVVHMKKVGVYIDGNASACYSFTDYSIL